MSICLGSQVYRVDRMNKMNRIIRMKLLNLFWLGLICASILSSVSNVSDAQTAFYKKVYSWQIGSWGSCDAGCDWGTETRAVNCSTRNSVVVPDVRCLVTKPSDSRSCYAGSCCHPNMGQTCYAIVPSSGYFDSGTGDCSAVGMCTGCAGGSVAECSGGLHKCSCNEGTVQCDGSCFWY
jgi:hypothetical protein